MSTPPQVEKELQRLRKLPENRICPNCMKQDTSFGFSAVCMAYKTFVCGDCKSAHQAFSHRCKSVSMSNWNMMEVQSLMEQNRGGNRVAAQQWLANCPESMRPSPDSHIDIKKAFVTKAYDKKEWISTGELAAPTPARQPPASQTTAPKAPPVQARPTAQMVNLLDDDAFDSPAASTPAQVPAKAPAAECNLLDDAFFSPQAAPQNTASVASTGSAFSFLSASASATPPVASSGSAFSFISAQGSQPASAEQSSFPFCAGQASFDPLAAATTAAPAQQLQPHLLAGNFGGGLPGGMYQQGFPCQQQQQQQQQQQAWSPHVNIGGYGQMMSPNIGGYGQMMNPCMPSGCAAFGQPCQAPMPAGPSPVGVPAFPFVVSGNPVSVPTLASAAPVAACGSKMASGQPVSRAESSFDPFDPFAPESVSVRC